MPTTSATKILRTRFERARAETWQVCVEPTHGQFELWQPKDGGWRREIISVEIDTWDRAGLQVLNELHVSYEWFKLGPELNGREFLGWL